MNTHLYASTTPYFYYSQKVKRTCVSFSGGAGGQRELEKCYLYYCTQLADHQTRVPNTETAPNRGTGNLTCTQDPDPDATLDRGPGPLGPRSYVSKCMGLPKRSQKVVFILVVNELSCDDPQSNR